MGPLLFILFINDLPLNVTHSELDMYADDTTLTVKGKTTEELESKLNEDMQNVSDWCIRNKMKANTNKTKVMMITTRQKRQTIPIENRELNVYLGNEKLGNAETEKLLGVKLNNNMSWEQHITHILSIANRKLALLRRIKKYLPLRTRKLFYNAHILPHLDYCSAVWGTSPHVQKLCKLQKRAARVILDVKDIRFPSALMFERLGWMPLQDRIAYRKLVLVHKALHQSAPAYITNMFKYIHELRNRTTRSSRQK